MTTNDTSETPKEYGKLRPSEKVLGIIALLMLVGWVFRWLYVDEADSSTGFPWFLTFSIPSAVIVLVLIFLKLNVIEILPGKLQEKMLPYISLLPVLGFLIAELNSFQRLLTVGGAMALAYISATSYWRNYIPDFVTNPLGAKSPAAGEPEKSSPTDTKAPAPPPAAPPPPAPQAKPSPPPEEAPAEAPGDSPPDATTEGGDQATTKGTKDTKEEG